MPNAPQPTLPKTDVMAKGPVEGLKEIRTSFSSTLSSVEANLPAGAPTLPTGAGLPTGVPSVEQFAQKPFQGIKAFEESLPEGMPKFSEAVPEVPGAGTPQGAQRGTTSGEGKQGKPTGSVTGRGET